MQPSSSLLKKSATISSLPVATTTLASGLAALSLLAYYRLQRRRATGPDQLVNLADFATEEVLLESDWMIVVLGRFSWQAMGEKALVKLVPKPLSLARGLLGALDVNVSSYSGAEYCYYDGRCSLTSLCMTAGLRPAYKVEVIAPASEKQIARVRPERGTLITEDAALYARVVQPFIESMDPKAIAWVANLLALKKETERLLFNDSDTERGFLLNIDTKWKSHPPCVSEESARVAWRCHASVQDLYCLAICHRRDLRSLRDLRARHLPLLRHILHEGCRVIEAVYGVPVDELRVFVHYQPQFYHFHVHFTRLHNDLGCQVERAHLLPQIIAELEADGDAYAKKTLWYQLKANDKLLEAIRAADFARFHLS